jgi:membrane-associated phospholipid phosphatase
VIGTDPVTHVHEGVLGIERAGAATSRLSGDTVGWWNSGKAQALLFAAAYATYRVAYGFTASGPDVAVPHGASILSAERTFGIAIEPQVQERLHALTGAFTAVYLCAQLLVIWLVLAWAWRAAPRTYRRLRTAVLGSWVVGIGCFATWPAAPPRFVPDAGVANSLADAFGNNAEKATVIYNPYAAMPSLHCAFALLAGLALWHSTRRPWRFIGIAWPAAVGLATVATGNHWMLDVVAGFALAAVAWALACRVRTNPRAAAL